MVDPEHTLLSERRRHRRTQCVSPSTGNVQNGQSHAHRKQIRGCQGPGGKRQEEALLLGTGSPFRVTEIFRTRRRCFLGGSMVRNPPANAGDPGSVPGSGRSPWQRVMATHPSILARRIPWTEKPGGPQSMGWQRVRHNLATK